MEDTFIGAARHIIPEGGPRRIRLRSSRTCQPRGKTKEDKFIGAARHINTEVGPWRRHL
jgi:hypothetical protein